MTTPQSYIAVEPLAFGVVCALFYIEHGEDVYGWWSGTRDTTRHSVYFRVERFFTTRSRQLYTTDGMDLYRGWAYVHRSRTPTALVKPVPLDEDIVHELDRVQGWFAAEWLFGADDPHVDEERFAYDRLGLPLQPLNVHSRQIDKFDKTGPVWIQHTRGFNAAVTDYLRHYWPLDYPSRLRSHME